MPGKIKVKILAGRNLPVMDRSGDTTDAYVEIKFGNTTYKTDVCRKTLNPQWNSEWYRFEVDDAELQDEPLQIRLMDHDTYSANDAIGKVYLNLNPLLLPGLPLTVKNIWTLEATMNSSTGAQGGSVMTGWIPVFDTMHGIRGEVNIIVKVELFPDWNKHKQSSCGVSFFYSPNVPHGYHAQVVHGFVEELIVCDDPEYKWIDKIRTPRASNEARQTLFFKISGEVQRKIGLKALDLGGNAVIGYVQNFDLEGESGIVARGIGTAVTLIKLQDISTLPMENLNVEDLACFSSQNKNQFECSESDDSMPLLSYSPPSHSPSPRSPIKIHTTQIGSKFPKYEKNSRHLRPAMRITEHKASSMKARQMSLQHSPTINMRKGVGSSLSLSDDLIFESSLRSLLALEDMRGERTSAFSRGLKNLKHLPKRVIQMKSKISDSFDDESDQDSIYSSTWSVIGSDTTRSSIGDLGQSNRRKKFTHKKNSPDSGIAALLIRSVHTGFPLDSVREDRETPTPSPVNILTNNGDSPDSSVLPLKCLNNFDDIIEEQNLHDSISPDEVLLEKPEPLYNYVDNKCVRPMISSSETDTSTSEEDEPSESSTNYNILDDSFTTIESTLTIDSKLWAESGVNIIGSSDLFDSVENTSNVLLSPENDTDNMMKARQDSVPEGLILDDDTITDEVSTLLLSKSSASEDELKNQECSVLAVSLKSSPLRTSPSFKLKILGKQENFDSNDEFQMTIPLENEPLLSAPETFPLIDLTSKSEVLPMKTEISIDISKEITNSSIDIVEKHPTNDPVKYNNELTGKLERNLDEIRDVSSTAEPTVPYKKYLFHTTSLDKKSSMEKKEKSCKKVSRTETVIYKGPAKDKEKPCMPTDHKDITGKIIKTTHYSTVRNSPTIIIAPPSEPDSHLRVPMADTKDIKVHSPYPQDTTKVSEYDVTSCQENFLEPNLISERFIHKARQHCMLDLIKMIDAKMMVHGMAHDRKDSAKKKRRDRVNLTSTPSPDSIRKSKLHRRNSRSKSPEKHHHHHHHHSSHHNHQTSSLATHSVPHSINPPFKEYPLSSLTSIENLSKNNTTQCLYDPQPVCTIEKLISRNTSDNLDESNKAHEIAARQLTVFQLKNPSTSDNISIPMDIIKTPIINSQALLSPGGELDASVHKSHSEGSLGKLKNHLTKNTNIANITDDPCVPCPPLSSRQPEEQSTSPVHLASGQPASVSAKATNSPAAKTPLHRRSSDSDLSITPKGNSLAGSDRSMGHLRPSTAIVRTMNQDALEMLEYPFITIQQYPPGFVLNLGGLVSARSVKLIDRISNLEEPESRDAWWKEIRMEVRSHARALGCNVVLGYKEEISICDDVCVLNASGTAAVINLLNTSQDQDVLQSKAQQSLMTSTSEAEKSQQKTLGNKNEKTDDTSVGQNNVPIGTNKRISESNDNEINHTPLLTSCNLCHLPYSESSVPFKVDVSKCVICRRAKVPDVLFTTIELPENIPITGRGVFLQATVCKSKRDLRGELNAKEISDCLPFLEYELHSLLLNKLKIKGMNGIFGLKVQVSIGERLIIGMAVGTAVFLSALPTPSIPKIASGNSWHNEEQLAEIQKSLIETVKQNRELYRLKVPVDIENGRSIATSDTDESDDDLPDLDLSLGTKDACVLEVDDVEDMDRINLLRDDSPPADFHVVNTQSIPGLEDLEIVRNLQMFTQISRAKIPSGQFASMPAKYFAKMLQTILFKLRKMVPCALCDMQFKVALPEPDEIQLSVVGMALGLGEPTKVNKYKRKAINNSTSKDLMKKSDENDLIFNLDEDQAENINELETANKPHISISNSSTSASHTQRPRPRSPFKTKPHTPHAPHRPKHVPLKERYGVDITPLSYLPGGKIERYLGNLNFFFIRESTSIRENGGLSGFTHSFITEILAIVRAHITALGGNAMLAFFMTQCVLLHSPHKNHGQCLVNVGGDVVSVSYFGDEKHNQNC